MKTQLLTYLLTYLLNTDHKNDFSQMHLLKCDVHMCCKNPHENLLIAYMKRLKRLRNDIHTKYNFLSDRNIRD